MLWIQDCVSNRFPYSWIVFLSHKLNPVHQQPTASGKAQVICACKASCSGHCDESQMGGQLHLQLSCSSLVSQPDTENIEFLIYSKKKPRYIIWQTTYLQEIKIVKKTSDIRYNLSSCLKNFSKLQIQHQVQITLSISCFLKAKSWKEVKDMRNDIDLKYINWRWREWKGKGKELWETMRNTWSFKMYVSGFLPLPGTHISVFCRTW